MNKIIYHISVIVLVFPFLLGCATTYHGDAMVIETHKTGKKNHLKTAKKTGTIGGVVGSTTLASAALYLGTTEMTVGSGLLGAAIWAPIGFGIVGVPAALAGLVYSDMSDKLNSKDMYQFKVKLLTHLTHQSLPHN